MIDALAFHQAQWKWFSSTSHDHPEGSQEHIILPVRSPKTFNNETRSVKTDERGRHYYGDLPALWTRDGDG